MEKMLTKLISGFFNNISIIFIVLAIIIAGAKVLIRRISNKTKIYEEFYRWTTLLSAGFIGIYTFIAHAFFPEISAANIGWQTSPFQYEVAVANLGFGLCCILAFWASYSFRLATVIGISCWLWGNAVGHIREMIVAHNFSPGNAGPWFWSDVIVPLLLIIFISLSKKPKEES